MINLLINLCIITPLYLGFFCLMLWLSYHIGMWALNMLEKFMKYKDRIIK